MTTRTQRPRSPITRHLFVDQLAGVSALWAILAVVVAGIIAAISTFGTIESSVWEQATHVPRWLAAIWGIYTCAVYLPLYITHGHTRRELAVRSGPFAAALAVVLGALLTVGYLIESLAYRAFGWPHVLTQPHLHGSEVDFPLIFAELSLVLAVWVLVGLYLGAAFYRSTGLGLILIPVGLAMLILTEGAIGTANVAAAVVDAVGILRIGPLSLFDESLSLTWPAATAIYVAVVATALALTWLVVRDLPVRSKNT